MCSVGARRAGIEFLCECTEECEANSEAISSGVHDTAHSLEQHHRHHVNELSVHLQFSRHSSCSTHNSFRNNFGWSIEAMRSYNRSAFSSYSTISSSLVLLFAWLIFHFAHLLRRTAFWHMPVWTASKHSLTVRKAPDRQTQAWMAADEAIHFIMRNWNQVDALMSLEIGARAHTTQCTRAYFHCLHFNDIKIKWQSESIHIIRYGKRLSAICPKSARI